MNATAQRSVRVAWDPNPETNIVGYNLYHGVVGVGPTNVLDVGPSTSGSVTNLSFGTRYFFYVTAYNAFDLESDPSTTLYYTAPVQVPISVTTEGDLLAFAPVEIRLPATLNGDASPGLEINWQQVWGPEQVTIHDGGSIGPTVQLETAGNYSFRVQVSDGSTSDQADVVIVLMEPAVDSGTANPLKLEPPQFLIDGIAFYWNSDPNAYYHVGLKHDLNLPYWILLERDIPSQGVYTYWVDDGIDFSQSGFYGIFQAQ